MAIIQRRLIATACVLAVVFVSHLMSSDEAHSQNAILFGIRPANVGADAPAQGAYFTYTMEPGDSLQDEAVAVNSGEERVSLSLYAADGVTAIGGGTAFAAADEDHNGVRSWLSTEESQLELGPGESVAIPFTVTVPMDAKPGDHVAGWVVEGPPKVQESEGFNTAVVERVGVAVVVHVPGRLRAALTLGQMCMNQDSGSNYVEAPASNDGNVLTRGNGSLVFTTAEGDEVFRRAVELDTVLPGDDTLLRIDAPTDPGPGDYVASLTLDEPNGHIASVQSNVRIGDEKLNGCLTATSPEQQPPAEADGSPALPGRDVPWLVVILGSVAALLAAILAAREFIWRRRRM